MTHVHLISISGMHGGGTVYLIQNSADLHKLSLTLIYLAKMALIFNIVDKHAHLDVGVS